MLLLFELHCKRQSLEALFATQLIYSRRLYLAHNSSICDACATHWYAHIVENGFIKMAKHTFPFEFNQFQYTVAVCYDIQWSVLPTGINNTCRDMWMKCSIIGNSIFGNIHTESSINFRKIKLISTFQLTRNLSSSMCHQWSQKLYSPYNKRRCFGENSILHDAPAVNINHQGWLTPAEKLCRQINAQKYVNGIYIATSTSVGWLTHDKYFGAIPNDK